MFTIVMTLLVLELISNDVTNAKSAADLHNALLELWPKVLSYVISFAVAGVFWVDQHAYLHYVEHNLLNNPDAQHGNANFEYDRCCNAGD